MDFDILHIVEWDLLLFDSLANLYANVPRDGIGLTALIPLKEVQDRWSWTTQSPWKEQWAQLLQYARNVFAYNKEPYASLGPGACLPKGFLEKYSAIEVPELCHDELRLPLFGQVLDFKLYDTGFYGGWHDSSAKKFFNCNGIEIEPELINEELSRGSGKRVFHPFRKRRSGILLQSITESS